MSVTTGTRAQRDSYRVKKEQARRQFRKLRPLMQARGWRWDGYLWRPR